MVAQTLHPNFMPFRVHEPWGSSHVVPVASEVLRVYLLTVADTTTVPPVASRLTASPTAMSFPSAVYTFRSLTSLNSTGTYLRISFQSTSCPPLGLDI